ncbi:TetR/AcrR family transcriptional regulator [Kitasatospora sp. NPDC048296]|uniref:TetR/AcrR family transcriptional regulator n=1 Tax=Kitasatospora sp. NPDC048296 TaxID=3364048 RepID=UPI00371F3D3D
MQDSSRDPGVRAGKRHGPRNASAVFEATMAMLAEHGYDRLTIEGVAARSGVNKTTIYRWWPSKDDLVAAALTDAALLTFDVPDTGSLRGDLTALVDYIARLLTEPPLANVAIGALGALPQRPELSRLMREYFDEMLARELAIFQRAASRGELVPGTDAETVLDLLGGALWFHTVVRPKPVDAAFVKRIVEYVLTGVLSAP